MKKHFFTWVKTVSGGVAEDGKANEFDRGIEKGFEELRDFCETGKWVPTSVSQGFTSATNGSEVLCVCTITAQLVTQEYMDSQQQRAVLLQQQNGFRR